MSREVTGGCGSATHLTRRSLFQAAAGLAGATWVTGLAESLARAAEKQPKGTPAKSVIVLWMAGGPSQLETFDPHPGTSIGGEARAIETNVKGIKIAAGMPQTAEQMDSLALVRAVTSKEGDHERATYTVKTGFRPDPTLVHPSIGSVLCFQKKDGVEIPRHVSILPGPWPARGGYLGDQYDAFKINDPINPIPDVRRRVPDKRFDRRVDDLFKVVENEFARGRLRDLDARKTLQGYSTRGALRMMTSEQLKAFDIKRESQSLRDEYGDTPFGRGCLAAVRLIKEGVRCVEVTLGGWDTHINNHELQTGRVDILDPALAAMIRDLKRRKLLDSTLVVCGGEFGRTPTINPAGGRDHWPHGFTIAMAGGGIRGGQVVGETAPEPKLDEANRKQDLTGDRPIADIHATIFKALDIDFTEELMTPVGRPKVISEGTPIDQLLG